MYPRSFLCQEAKIKQRTPLKKELYEIGEEAIWESQFTSFLKMLNVKCVSSVFYNNWIIRIIKGEGIGFYLQLTQSLFDSRSSPNYTQLVLMHRIA